ncbi:hypothetical protein A8U91_03994 [Halomonas elongata]|uniref:Uncharacterized protein n=1 Tax=Halomonas elongata TaxID=2746 RepID=A0A1B8NY42_HALEL|nr:hypothetical protein A8U91_03994 [Halomonas elongata]
MRVMANNVGPLIEVAVRVRSSPSRGVLPLIFRHESQHQLPRIMHHVSQGTTSYTAKRNRGARRIVVAQLGCLVISTGFQLLQSFLECHDAPLGRYT